MAKTRRKQRGSPSPVQRPPQRPPSEREAEAIAKARERASNRRKPVKLNLEHDGNGVCNISSDHSDGVGWLARLTDVFGTASEDFQGFCLNGLLNAVAPRNGTVSAETANALLAVVDGVRPKDEIEAMLASQMAVTHSLAMEFLGRAKRAELVPQFKSFGNLSVKLLRTYTAQVEALAKLRRGGEQTVRVEHVHVHPGAQAVVGNVNHKTNKDECPAPFAGL